MRTSPVYSVKLPHVDSLDLIELCNTGRLKPRLTLTRTRLPRNYTTSVLQYYVRDAMVASERRTCGSSRSWQGSSHRTYTRWYNLSTLAKCLKVKWVHMIWKVPETEVSRPDPRPVNCIWSRAYSCLYRPFLSCASLCEAWLSQAHSQQRRCWLGGESRV